jgi:hypothetical protein
MEKKIFQGLADFKALLDLGLLELREDKLFETEKSKALSWKEKNKLIEDYCQKDQKRRDSIIS